MSARRHAVIGAGIIGLALARALAVRGESVVVYDTDQRPQGASIRNFGTLWPIGQPAGARRRMAIDSLRIWRDVLVRIGAWHAPAGSLHLAHHQDELQVLEEFASISNASGFPVAMLTPDGARERCARLRPGALLGALWSEHEVQINPRQVSELLRAWLARELAVTFRLGARVTSCDKRTVCAAGARDDFSHVWVASGTDTHTLYPDWVRAAGLQHCKLQMMRTAPVDWPVGPVLAGGLTLAHYEAFANCPGIAPLRTRLLYEHPMHAAFGVHVLISRHDAGQLVIGDSHEYGPDITPFDNPAIDNLILDYARTLVDLGPMRITERWHGVYVKYPTGPYWTADPEPGVTVVNGLGGHGMTLSFGLAEQLVEERLTA